MRDSLYETEKEERVREAREEWAEERLNELVIELLRDFDWNSHCSEEVKDMLRKSLENKRWGRKG